jgi:hypothetical protein
MLLPISPLFLFALKGNVSIDFDDEDFEEIKEHPMAGPAMATFN